MANIDSYISRASSMISNDTDRDAMFSGIDDMWNGTWQLPSTLGKKPDLRTIIDMSPHDALRSGSTIMSTSMPHWVVQPLAPNQAEQERAERIAYAVDFNYKRMNRRGKSTLLWDIVHSSLRYDAIAIWLDYLPYQFGSSPTLRQKHALRGGDFAAVVHNPRNVHIQEDDYGVNCILLSVNVTAQEVVSKWGKRASKLERDLKDEGDDGSARFALNDMMLYEGNAIKRIVWGNIVTDEDTTEGDDTYVIMDEEIATPFMPWIVQFGGTNLEKSPDRSIHPLLAPLYKAHKWEDLNVFQSVLQSEIIKYGRTPRVKTVTPSGEGVVIDYEDGTTLNLSAGQDAQPWKPAPIDSALASLVDRVRAEVSASTLPRILQNPEFAGNTPFASINAMIQTALGGLNASKVLAERAHEQLALRMVEWCKFANKPLLAYRDKKLGVEGIEPGTPAYVTPEELDSESIIVSCKLFAEAPTDFAQRLNAAILMNQQLKVPRSDVLAEMGRSNIDSLYEQWVQEQYDDQTIQMDIEMTKQKAAMQLQMQGQMMQQQMQMQMQQQMQAQQQAQQQAQMAQEQQMAQQMEQQQQSGGYPSNAQGIGMEMPPGQGFNPNATVPPSPPGVPTTPTLPQQGQPGVSGREMALGQDVTGTPT